MRRPTDLAPDFCTWLPFVRSLQSYRSVVEHSANLISRTLHCKIAGIMLYDEASGELALETPTLGIPDDLAVLYRVRLSDGGNAVRVFTTGKPYISNDCPSDPLIIQRFIRMYNVKNLVTVPVSVDGQIIGVIHAANRTRGEFTARDAETLRVLGSGIGIVVQQSREIAALRRAADALRAQLEQASGLLRAAMDLAHALAANRTLLPLQDVAHVLNLSLAIYDGSRRPLGCWGDIDHSLASKMIESAEHELDKPGQAVIRLVGDRSFILTSLGHEWHRFGYLIVQCDRYNMDDLKVSFSVYLSSLISLLLGQKKVVENSCDLSIRINSSLLRDIVAGSDEAPLSQLLRLLRNRIGAYCLMVLLVISENNLTTEEMVIVARRVYETASNLVDEPIVALLGNSVVSFLPDSNDARKIVEFIAGVDVGGRSCSVRLALLRLETEPDSIRTALTSLRQFVELCKYSDNEHRIIDFTDIWPLRELFSIHPDALRSIVLQVLGPILKLKGTERDILLSTAEVYVTCGFSVKKASVAENVHPSTVKYRLSRIQELLGVSLNDPDARFRIAMALRAYRLIRRIGYLP